MYPGTNARVIWQESLFYYERVVRTLSCGTPAESDEASAVTVHEKLVDSVPLTGVDNKW